MKNFLSWLFLWITRGIARYYPLHVESVEAFISKTKKCDAAWVTVTYNLLEYSYKKKVVGVISCESSLLPYGRRLYFSIWDEEHPMDDTYSENTKKEYTKEIQRDAHKLYEHIQSKLPGLQVTFHDNAHEEDMLLFQVIAS